MFDIWLISTRFLYIIQICVFFFLMFYLIWIQFLFAALKIKFLKITFFLLFIIKYIFGDFYKLFFDCFHNQIAY